MLIRRRRFRVDSPPGEYDRRVFVGGNYDFMATLRKICDYVSGTSFTPILAWDFDVPSRRIHDFDLRLLHQCRFAIFEETSPAGELMELERTRDYGTLAIVVYQVRDTDSQAPPSQITSMATTYGLPLVGYATFEQLEEFINRVFGAIRTEAMGEALETIFKAHWLPPKTKALVMRALRSANRRGTIGN